VRRLFLFIATVLAIGLFALTQSVMARESRVYVVQAYLEVTVDEASVYSAPDLSSEVVVKAQKGDIFRSYGTDGEWYEIAITELPLRFIHKSVAESTDAPKLEVTEAVRKNICMELDAVYKQANEESFEKLQLGGDSYRWFLLQLDRQSLPIFREFGISSALNDELDCFELLQRDRDLILFIDTATFILSWMALFIVIGGIGWAIANKPQKTRLPKSIWAYLHFLVYLAWVIAEIRHTLSGGVLVQEWVLARTLSAVLVGLVIGLPTLLINRRILLMRQPMSIQLLSIALATFTSTIIFILLHAIGTLLIFDPWRGG
jgi:hypothetical protein